jgi:hypothetical protein
MLILEVSETVEPTKGRLVDDAEAGLLVPILARNYSVVSERNWLGPSVKLFSLELCCSISIIFRILTKSRKTLSAELILKDDLRGEDWLSDVWHKVRKIIRRKISLRDMNLLLV